MKRLLFVKLVLAAVLAGTIGCGSSTTKQTPYVTVKGDVAVKVGATLTLTAVTTDGIDSAYTWSSSDKTVATVDDKGVVTGVAKGTAVITATGTDTGASGSWGVHVYVEGATAKPQVLVSGDVVVKIGKTLTLAAQTINGTDSAYTWSSSDKAVATVDDKGVVTGVTAGQAIITATGTDTGASGSWGIAVTKEQTTQTLAKVSIAGKFSVEADKTLQLTAATANGTDSGYAWSSSNNAVATVDGTGLVTGVTSGEAVITATGNDTTVSATHGIVVIAQGIDVPFEDLWSGSGHADKKADAFNHWNKDGKIPVTCARCHSTPGFRDFLGADGTAAGVVDNPADTGTVITCIACHNTAAQALTSVTFPSGQTISGLGPEARCMTCHQGRESTDSVNAAITDAAPADDDTVSSKLSFINIHYFAAAATRYGSQVRGGYQYPGKRYDGFFEMFPGLTKCQDCHNVHSLEVKIDACADCHEGVTSVADLDKIRMAGSYNDYDGDGNVTEGIKEELLGVRAKLYSAILSYAKTVAGKDIVYSADDYPYFFVDTNGNGLPDTDETAYGNKYDAWTPRLLKAAYNYQFATKDPGGFAHNAKYIIEIMYDSIADLAQKVTIDMSKMARNDSGHFDTTDDAWRHWDKKGVVDAACSRCHAPPTGLAIYIKTGADPTSPQPVSSGMTCDTCHEDADGDAPRKYVDKVVFPGGQEIDNDPTDPDDSFLCMSCHQGRESTADVNAAITAAAPANDDAVPKDANGKPKLSFLNVHYLSAGATLYGDQAKVGYEYAGKTYAGKFGHHGDKSAQCVYCHQVSATKHSFEPQVTTTCTICHSEATVGDVDTIRKNRTADYNGNGNTTEPLDDEIQGLASTLYSQIKLYAAAHGGAIVYAADSYPYFFKDTNTNGVADPDETTYGNKYLNWSPRLLRAAYNYQYSQKEPGAWAHNTDYIAQLLIDSIADLGGDVSGLSRP